MEIPLACSLIGLLQTLKVQKFFERLAKKNDRIIIRQNCVIV